MRPHAAPGPARHQPLGEILIKGALASRRRFHRGEDRGMFAPTQHIRVASLARATSSGETEGVYQSYPPYASAQKSGADHENIDVAGKIQGRPAWISILRGTAQRDTSPPRTHGLQQS